MKKLIVAIVAVALGVNVNAASYTWSCTSSFFDGTGTTGKMSNGTSVYLMFASAYSQSDLVSDFAAGGITTSKAVATTTISSAKFSTSNASFDTTDNQTAYLAIVYGDRLFISTTADAAYTSVGTGSINFDSQAYLTRYNNTSSTLLPDNPASAGYAGAGWYNVPEPTSGLLILLGMAGLALKRKRA